MPSPALAGGGRLAKYKAEAGIDLGQTKRAKASQRFSKKSWRFLAALSSFGGGGG
jgi:hypothetical protein